MDDYISRKTALATVLSMYSRCDTNSLEDYRDLMVESVNVLPAADVVEVVRCKDCKHKHLENMVWTCPFGLSSGENFFCGYGAEPYKGEKE